MSTGLTFEASTSVINRIACAQNELLDYTGHVTKGLPRAHAQALVSEINDKRASVNWTPLDMKGRWRR